MTRLAGVGGALFPSRFLADWLTHDAAVRAIMQPEHGARRRLLAWWRRVESSCGPATGLRTLFDVAAMPLAGLLGFRAHDALFDRTRVSARLTTKRGSTVGFILLPWAERPSRLWRDLAAGTREIGADWCLLVAPPFVSLVDGRGHTIRRSLDFLLPDALDERSFPAFWLLCQAGAFDRGTKSNPGIERSKPGIVFVPSCQKNDTRLRSFDPRIRSCSPIDQLVLNGMQFQDAVRADLRTGVVSALAAIGPVLPGRDAARFGEALTLIYRVLFLLFAESRDLVPSRHPAYGPAYALGSLCRDASRDPGGADGLWDGLAAITRLSRTGCESADLIVRPFNGRLFARASAPALEGHPAARVVTRASRRRDRAIAAALTALGTRPGPGGRESIAYADLGVEQLGAVYEHVLDLDPEQVLSGTPACEPARSPAGRAPHGLRRKETGTFYTPQALAAFVVRRTLAPLVRGATTDEILALRVVDPAMGSGAFLVAACRYLAHAYEGALVNEGRCAETDLDAHERADIRRLIARRCLAGVDANPVAVQLARLSLWLTTLARDKPLTFLDDRLRVGDSIVGTSPDDLWRVPRRPGARRRTDEAPLFEAAGLAAALQAVSQPLRQLSEQRDDSVADVRAKERMWAGLTGDRSPIEPWRAACHLWCARWFWPDASIKPPSPAELSSAMDAMLRGDRTLGAAHVQRWLSLARAVAADHGFFHWPLEFADVFYDDSGAPRDRPGFDAVIGNPPWEMLRRDRDDTRAADPARARQARTLAFVRDSGQYRSCDRGHLNLYQPFLERSLAIARRGGRVGLVLPWGFASDEGAAALRARTFDQGAVDAMVGFDNAEGIFPIHRGLRFLAIVASPGSEPREIRARFGVRAKADIDDLPGDADADDRSAFPIRLSAPLLRRVGGAALRIPDARRPGDLEWLERVSRAFPRLGDRAGWGLQFGRELNATEDRSSFGPAGTAGD